MAQDYYESSDYDKALLHFSLYLKEFSEDKEAKLGVLLCDVALDSEEQSKVLYNYYKGLKNINNNPEDVVFSVIEAFDKNLKKINHFIEQTIKVNVVGNGIRYEDFKRLVKDRGNFKQAFEDLIFSTKVVIDKKEDFVDFINKLIENNYYDMAYHYLENAISGFPYEKKFFVLLQELSNKETNLKINV
jgi:tetratricopeptide (TPR) repeat protein